MRVKRNSKEKTAYFDFWKNGISYSFIQSFLTCREQCRLRYMEGWRSNDLKKPFVMGDMIQSVMVPLYRKKSPPITSDVLKQVAVFETIFKKQNPNMTPQDLEMLDDCAGITEALLPPYFKYWVKEDWNEMDWIGSERQWNLKWEYEDGKTLPLHGYWDAITRWKKSRYVFETKTAARPNQADIADLLPFDMQSMLYVYALSQDESDEKVGGVYYNVIKKPGQYRGKSETRVDFFTRVTKLVATEPDKFFFRWRNPVRPVELDTWVKNQLSPILDDIRMWIEGKSPHYLNPFNLVTKYGRSDLFQPIVFDNYTRLTREHH